MKIASAFICVLFAASSVPLIAQIKQSELDSLHRVAYSQSPDTVRIKALSDLCYYYRGINQDSALKFGHAAVDQAALSNFRSGKAQAHSDLAFVYFDRGDMSMAATHWKIALQLRTQLGDGPRIASLLMKLGATSFRSGDYSGALHYQLDALKRYEAMGMSSGIGQALNNVAAVYEHQQQLDKALEYYRKAYDIHSGNKNTADMATTLLNIGNIHFRRQDMPKAERAYRDVLSTLDQGGDQSNRAIALNNLSEIFVLKKNYDSALSLSQKALSIRRDAGDFVGIISSLNLTGRVNTQLGNYSEAEKYLKDALDLAGQKHLLPEEERVNRNLYLLYKEQKRWEESLYAHENFSGVRDSLQNAETKRAVAEMQVRYETEKKEQQIKLQDAEINERQLQIERDALVIGSLIAVLVLLIVIFFLARNSYHRRQEMTKREQEIAVREIFIKATIESQENERKRFARDLHDGLGQWISALKLVLNEIQTSTTDEQKMATLEKSDRILKDINFEFRSIAFNLMPQALIHSGLEAAFREMVQRLNSVGPPIFTINSFEFPKRLGELPEIALYRIVQEWSNNIIKYANAASVSIQLIGHEDELVVIIEDDGIGFDTSSLEKGAGNGWKNIVSRSNLIKATVAVDSTPDRRGTTFTIQLPRAEHSSLIGKNESAFSRASIDIRAVG